MSLFRRWFDPVRSRWYYDRPYHQAQLPTDKGISIYLRLDDVYSYLAVQQLEKLEQILVEHLKPLHIVISDHVAAPPNEMTAAMWQKYSLNDAKILAMQHGFAFDDVPEVPSRAAVQQAQLILLHTALRGQDFLYLLEDVFHMLWNQQYGKLKMLYRMAKNYQTASQHPPYRIDNSPLLSAYFEFGGRKYQAVDDLLRLTRRLQQQKLLTTSPIFLINHIEWREHLLSDAEELAEIQALRPELDLYVALEDPFTWLLLSYIKEELADFYNIDLTLLPLPYQGRDVFDWSLANRLSQRTEVEFTPFCRPDAQTSSVIAHSFYRIASEQRVDALLEMLRQTWTRGKDLTIQKNLHGILENFNGYADAAALPDDNIQQQLQQNMQQCKTLQQPDLPVMVLRIAGQEFIFNSLYRVWMIESIFSNILARRYHVLADDT